MSHREPISHPALLGDGEVITDARGIVLSVNESAAAMFHRRAEGFVGRPFGYGGPQGNGEQVDIFLPDGTRAQARIESQPMRWEGSPAWRLILHPLADPTQHKLQASLQKSNSRFRTLINASPLAIVTLNGDGTVMFWNRQAERLFGWSGLDVLGRQPPIRSQDGGDDFARLCTLALQGESVQGMELLRQQTRDGRCLDLALWATPLDDSSGFAGGVMALLADVTEQKRVEAQVHHLATHDSLTGLPNRALLTDRLSQWLRHHRRDPEGYVAVLHVGLRHFRAVNESLGLASGDALIREAARRLERILREADTLARHEGAAFSVLVPDLTQDTQAAQVARRILSALEPPFLIEGQEVFLAASIGIALSGADGDDAESLLRFAQTAMHRAHKNGLNSFRFHDPDMNVQTMERMLMATSLRHALERRELLIHYQPITELTSGRTVAMEALLRWQHPELGMIQPDQFIPLAEEEGLIVPIGAWVLRTACRQARAWLRQGLPPLRLCVNLSARQCAQPELAESVAAALRHSGLPPHLLELELTESVLADPGGHAAEQLRAIRASGVGISIDDFGTGYSSLSYLKHFPVNTLKVDRSFVSETPEDRDSVQLCAAIVAMAHGLGLRVIAEGVERHDQLEFLRRLECDEVQGYLYSRPLAPEDMETYLARPGETRAREVRLLS